MNRGEAFTDVKMDVACSDVNRDATHDASNQCLMTQRKMRKNKRRHVLCETDWKDLNVVDEGVKGDETRREHLVPFCEGLAVPNRRGAQQNCARRFIFVKTCPEGTSVRRQELKRRRLPIPEAPIQSSLIRRGAVARQLPGPRFNPRQSARALSRTRRANYRRGRAGGARGLDWPTPPSGPVLTAW